MKKCITIKNGDNVTTINASFIEEFGIKKSAGVWEFYVYHIRGNEVVLHTVPHNGRQEALDQHNEVKQAVEA